MNAHQLDWMLRAAAQTSDVLSLAGGLPAPESFPRAEIAQAADHAILAMGTAPLQYDWPEGRKTLRELIAARLRARGADVEAEDVLITNGAQDAIAIAIDVLAPVAVQVDPHSYPGAREIFRSRGCRVSARPAEVRYAMPALTNPGGEVASVDSRASMLESRWVLEDDAYADLVFDRPAGRPLLAEARAQVFQIGTFSKVLSPGLRVGWLVPPRSCLRRARDAKMCRDLHAGGLAQAITERLLEIINLETRLGLLRSHYRNRCTRMIEALSTIPALRYRPPKGGFSLWAEIDLPGTEAGTEAEAEATSLAYALEEGVSFDPGSRFRADEGERPLAMRLSFSALDEARIPEAIERLSRALARLAGSPHLSRSSHHQLGTSFIASSPRPRSFGRRVRRKGG